MDQHVAYKEKLKLLLLAVIMDNSIIGSFWQSMESESNWSSSRSLMFAVKVLLHSFIVLIPYARPFTHSSQSHILKKQLLVLRPSCSARRSNFLMTPLSSFKGGVYRICWSFPDYT